MAGAYLYAITPTDERVSFDTGGGNGDAGLHTVVYDGLSAVVGCGDPADFRQLTKEEAVRHLLAHERVVESVMQIVPLLPVKFGTILPDDRVVERLLAQGRHLFRGAIERLAGFVQMEIVVLWNVQHVFAEIGQERPIAELKDRIVGQAADSTFRDRVALGQMVQASFEARRAALRDELLVELRGVAHDLVLNAPMDDQTVANVGLLVNRGQGREVLDRTLGLLDERFAGKLTLRCLGPLPPYSFATVEVRLPRSEEIDEARRRLGLQETANTDEIKAAFRRLATQMHPDLNPGDPDAQTRMVELNQAYRLARAYADSQADDQDDGDGTPAGRDNRNQNRPCCFSREACERALLIGIRRQDVEE